MTFLTCYTFAPTTASAALLSDPYRLHQWVLDRFELDPARPGRAQLDIQHTVVLRRGVVLVRSQVEPKTADRVDARLLAASTRTETPNTTSGTEHRFVLAANPVGIVHRKDGSKTKGPLRTADERRAWLDRKGAEYGFEVVDAVVGEPVRSTFGRRGKVIDMTRVDYHGILRVTEPEAFETGLRTGIGRGKAFGFGMLVLA